MNILLLLLMMLKLLKRFLHLIQQFLLIIMGHLLDKMGMINVEHLQYMIFHFVILVGVMVAVILLKHKRVVTE